MDPDGSLLSYWELWAVAALLLCSAFFSASETALTAISRLRIRTLVEQGVTKANLLAELTEEPAKVITAILIGNNVVNIVASTIATAVAIDIWGPVGAGISAAFMTLMILTFGEILPKSIATYYVETVSLLVARPIFLLTRVLSPVIAVFNGLFGLIVRWFGGERSSATVTEDEIRTIIALGQEHGVLEKHEHDIIRSVFHFGETTAEEVMVPRVDIKAVPITASPEELAQAFAETQFSRLPVYEGTLENIIGAVHMKDFVRAYHGNGVSLVELVRPVLFVPETLAIEAIYTRMKRQRISTAIVLDEYGQTVGMLTRSDIVEEIMGDFVDEHGELNGEPIALNEGTIEVDGSYLLEDLNEEFQLSLPTDVVNTVGGYIFHKLGRIPKVNDRLILADNVEALVVEMNGRRVGKVRLIRKAPLEH